MDKEDSIVTVLVPAAGRGARMGGIRKQYRQLGGEPLLVRTLHHFEASARVDHIVVAAPADDVSSLAGMLREHDIHKLHTVVAGRASRQASVAAALEAAPEETDIVLVHDAVRPFVPEAGVDAVIDAAGREGAAALAVPVTDTLRRGDRGIFGESVDRDGLYHMQTPQAFRQAWLVEAHRDARSDGYEGTDDVALVQRTGRRVALVLGSPLNIKITTQEDWMLAETLWARHEQNPAADA